MLIHQIRQTQIPIIAFILFVIKHHKHVFLIRIQHIETLVSHVKLPFPLFIVEPKFLCQMRPTWILIIILIYFMTRHHKHIILIRIHNVDALVLPEKFFFPPFSLKLVFIYQMRQTWILVIIFILFVIGQYKLIFRIVRNDFDALDS